MRGLQPSLKQEHPHDRRGNEPIAPAHDRRHDDPQVLAQDPTRLRAKGQELHFIPRAITRYGDLRGRRYQLYLASSGVGVPTLNQTVSTLRFFFKVTLGRSEIVEHTHAIHEPRKLPMVLSPEEVARLLDAAPGLKYKAALSVAYGAGLRATEVVSLKVSDIDSKRMIICVEQGKGGKDRNVGWWKAARPRGWLFPGRNPAQPMTTRQLNRACHAAAQMVEINRRGFPLRDSELLLLVGP
jgi:integrase